jgi:hypothetical protein
LRVESVAPLPGIHRVYNLTVEGEHVYYVGEYYALAHNNCPDQRALRDLVNEATLGGRRPLTVDDAETILD